MESMENEKKLKKTETVNVNIEKANEDKYVKKLVEDLKLCLDEEFTVEIKNGEKFAFLKILSKSDKKPVYAVSMASDGKIYSMFIEKSVYVNDTMHVKR